MVAAVVPAVVAQAGHSRYKGFRPLSQDPGSPIQRRPSVVSGRNPRGLGALDWYPRDVAAYRADTLHLTTLEHGAYSLLLDEYYLSRRPLPDNDRALANIARLTLAEWLQIAPTIRAFFWVKRGLLHQARADRELDLQDRRSQNRSKKAKKAAAIRHRKNNDLLANALLGDATETETKTEDSIREEKRGSRESLSSGERAGLKVIPGGARG